jgi:hypothetical protein
MRLRTTVAQGAPDTALRLNSSNLWLAGENEAAGAVVAAVVAVEQFDGPG